jgi:hypothetical protein
MPSPAIATCLALLAQLLDVGDFSGGFDLRFHRIEAELFGHGGGGAAVVAGEHDDLQAERVEIADGFGRGGFDRVGDGEHPRRLAIDSDIHRGLAFFLKLYSADASSDSKPAMIFSSRRKSGLPIITARPRRCQRPRPPSPSESLSPPRDDASFSCALHNRGGERGVRCSAPARRQAAGTPSRRNRLAGSTSISLGLPSVSVPVLSTTSVVTFSRRSSASAFFTSTPAWAPASDADHDGHGRGQAQRTRAGDDQHRNRVDEGMREPGLGAQPHPETKVSTETASTRGTKMAATLSARPLNRRAAALRLGYHVYDLPEQVSLPTRSARMTKLPVPLTVPPVTLSPTAFSTGRVRR